MKMEFAEIMIADLQSIFGPSPGNGLINDFYINQVAQPARRTYPYVVVILKNSSEDRLTTTTPKIEAHYQVHIVGRYNEVGLDPSVATKAMYDAGELADSMSEIIHNDSTLWGIGATLDIRTGETRFSPAEQNDFAEASMMFDVRATFSSNGGVYGYSHYGQATYG